MYKNKKGKFKIGLTKKLHLFLFVFILQNIP